MRLLRRLKIFLMFHWVKVMVIGVIILLVGLAVWGLASLESFYRRMTLATLPVQLMVGGLHALIFVFVYMRMFGRGFMSMKKSSIKGGKVNIHFDEVIGVDEAKDEAMEVVNLIKDHTRVKAIGGKIIKGLLLVGPPGTGKTLLAKAIATEAGIPFLSVAGSEFVEMFVGVGASRVRSLFKKARALAYAEGACIIFIDELEVIGKARQFSFMGSQESNTTQNQLLVEMDGLKESQENIVVIGATNAVEDILDPALLRPGRFDRKIFISLPFAEGREKLFKFYLNKVKHDPSIDFKRLANYTIQKSPADIENIVKEASLISTREDREMVEMKDITSALERIDLGIKRKRRISEKEKLNTAYHESGHAIVCYYLHPLDDVFKISIATRSATLGVFHHQPLEETYGKDREWYLAQIKTALGGYTAEKLRFKTTTHGVSSDFQSATQLAHLMVWRLGMGKNGSIGDYYASAMASKDNPLAYLSEEQKNKLNKETEAILQECFEDVENILTKESVLLDELVKALIEKEELEYDEIVQLCQEHGQTKVRRLETEGLLQKFREMNLSDEEKAKLSTPVSPTQAEPPTPEQDRTKEKRKEDEKNKKDSGGPKDDKS